ncbi:MULTISPECIES: WhiB family transcriptional regulator [unclassified Streptomyces]|uniref:WhiB family transcriptional regulator n=1 Tax=unclassified Streptomyces TaxID=2593676 RepID=UPI002E28E5FD|nr:WhiB family transcriptional regulator [Streptomyces sp. NBC_00228]
MDDADLNELRELQAERRKIEAQIEGHIRKAELATQVVGFDWLEEAACKASGLDPDCWFPESSADRKAAAQAQAVCWSCPVRLQCLQVACLRRDYGIWGGLLQAERIAAAHDYDVLKLIDHT